MHSDDRFFRRYATWLLPIRLGLILQKTWGELLKRQHLFVVALSDTVNEQVTLAVLAPPLRGGLRADRSLAVVDAAASTSTRVWALRTQPSSSLRATPKEPAT